MIRPDLDSIPAYSPGARAAGALKLSSNEVATPPLPSAVEAIARAAAHANRYPDMAAAEIREVLADHLGLTPDRVATGAGSSSLLQALVQAACTPGDEVLFAWRSFEAYPIFARVAGATPVMIPLTDTGLHDLDAMAAAITERTRVIFLCSPNNPSGATISTQAFRNFMARVPTETIVALDEAYYEFNRDEEAVVSTEELNAYPNLVAFRTMSKAYGLAGARLGYAFGPAPIIEAIAKVSIPFVTNSLAQAAAIASLDAADELMERTEEVVIQRDRVADRIGARRSQGNFVWLPGIDAAALAARLAEHGVLIRAFDEGARITVTTTEEMDRFLAAWDASEAASIIANTESQEIS